MRTAIGFALTAAIVSTFACHYLKPVSIDQARASNRVWLTLSDQSVVVVDGPQIYGNKLVGFVEGRYAEFVAANVTAVQVRVPHRARTAALVAASVLTVGGLMAWALGRQTTGGAQPDECDGPTPPDDICG